MLVSSSCLAPPFRPKRHPQRYRMLDCDDAVAHPAGIAVEAALMLDRPRSPRMPPLPLSFDGPLGQKIIELHVWAVGEGLRGVDASLVFDGLCRRLVGAGVPLWRAFAGMKTLNGAAMATLGGAVSTPFSPRNSNVATSTSRAC